MKLVILGLVSASLMGVGSAEAQQGRAHHNAASTPSGVIYNSSRAQTWYSDTGWQPGTSALSAYGYGYGYGGAGQHPPVILAAPTPPIIHGQQTYQVRRSQPFGYVVDGYGRYPWTSQAAYGQGQYQVQPQASRQGRGRGRGRAHGHAHHHHTAPAIPTQQETAPALILFDQGYFATTPETASPPPAAASPTERPYRQEPGERG